MVVTSQTRIVVGRRRRLRSEGDPDAGGTRKRLTIGLPEIGGLWGLRSLPRALAGYPLIPKESQLSLRSMGACTSPGL